MDDVWEISTTHSWINFHHSIVGLLSLECGIPRLHYATPAAMYSGFPDPPEPLARSAPWNGGSRAARKVRAKAQETAPRSHWSPRRCAKAPAGARFRGLCGPMPARARRPRAGAPKSRCRAGRLRPGVRRAGRPGAGAAAARARGRARHALIPNLVDTDPFHGGGLALLVRRATRPEGQAAPPKAAIRCPPVSLRAAWGARTAAHPAPIRRAKDGGEMGPYQRDLV